MYDYITRSASRSVHKSRFIMLFQMLRKGVVLGGFGQLVYTWTSHHALRCDGHLGESQEGLETKVGLRANLVGAPEICSLVWPVIWGVRLLWNWAFIWSLASINYEMLELSSDDLVWDQDIVRGTLLFLVSRGTQIPYSAAVDLVAGLGV
ncbi:hypothetical protein M9H77_14283 [Catharanthus roseus]|uniref:Uncharacterized protein n=1 Tax=Catharanthus roseus TaxID=4058 RepID=A0ACC0BMS2_CATRO|nr:hypothetical protein M9H77_14283 [Catharanthus roseus]